jgi:hypothetical protein
MKGLDLIRIDRLKLSLYAVAAPKQLERRRVVGAFGSNARFRQFPSVVERNAPPNCHAPSQPTPHIVIADEATAVRIIRGISLVFRPQIRKNQADATRFEPND